MTSSPPLWYKPAESKTAYCFMTHIQENRPDAWWLLVTHLVIINIIISNIIINSAVNYLGPCSRAVNIWTCDIAPPHLKDNQCLNQMGTFKHMKTHSEQSEQTEEALRRWRPQIRDRKVTKMAVGTVSTGTSRSVLPPTHAHPSGHLHLPTLPSVSAYAWTH